MSKYFYVKQFKIIKRDIQFFPNLFIVVWVQTTKYC